MVAHLGLERVLADREAAVNEIAIWPGDMKLQMSTYLGAADLPPELVVSVRCVVTVNGQVVVCEDAHSVDILPGGRCEPGESWQQTAQREVMEETGWHVDPDSLQTIGFIHFRHLTPVPAGHAFPQPDFLQVVMQGEGAGDPVDWVDVEGWVQRSWVASFEHARSLPLSGAGSAFLAVVGDNDFQATATRDPVGVTRRTYDAVAGEFKQSTGTPGPWLSQEMDAFLEAMPEPTRVLDVGCGPGRDTRMLRDRGAHVVGVDLSAGMLREADLGGLVQADMRMLPLRDGACEGVWCQAALLHVPRSDVGLVLTEFARVLRVNGRLHLSVSEGDGEGWETDRFGEQHPRWFVHHREAPLRTSLDDTGFTVLSVRHTVHGRNWLRFLALRRE